MSAETHEGGCYCGAIRFRITGAPQMKGQCFCRPCQYIAGGGPNYFMVYAPEAFEYTQGTPSSFTRSDLKNPRTREFCPTCGTPLVTIRPGGAAIVVKAGTLDDPAGVYGGPAVAIHCASIQPFHLIAEGVPRYEGLPT
ncbi:hypothetical protein HKCCE3408_10790 [Rhodobacterales bacterium HKCCE3408]|nr:hypothetical protein [Rhodobacterales bacterium HKCCE3408]